MMNDVSISRGWLQSPTEVCTTWENVLYAPLNLNRVTNNVGCPVADCPVDLGPNCRCNLFLSMYMQLI